MTIIGGYECELVYPQRFEDLYQIYDGSKNSNAIKCHLGCVLTKLL